MASAIFLGLLRAQPLHPRDAQRVAVNSICAEIPDN